MSDQLAQQGSPFGLELIELFSDAVSLTKTRKKGLEQKAQLIEEVRTYVVCWGSSVVTFRFGLCVYVFLGIASTACVFGGDNLKLLCEEQ